MNSYIKMNFISLIVLMLVTSLFSQEMEEMSIHQLHKKEYGAESKLPSKYAVDGSGIIPLKIDKSKELSKKVFGYLPDWEYIDGNHQYLRYDLLTHIAAFDFYVSNTGAVGNPSRWPWTDLINAAHSAGTKVILTAVNFDEDDIRKIITDSTVTQTFFVNVKNKIEAYNLDGVNIDFEGLYTADRGSVINNFMTELTEYIHTELPGKEVSFAGPAVNWGGYWDLDGLVQSCDYVFIMGYAFWGKWSSTSGPNAPLTGFRHDITSTVTEDYGVPVSKYPKKVILGVPYYGHKWRTISGDAYAEVDDNNGGFQSSTRFRSDITNSDTHGLRWDTKSQTSWYRWQEGNQWLQVWFDDVLSLDKKYDLADAYNLGGIGMWALGYDGSRQELWNLINLKYGDGSLPTPNTPRSFRVLQADENTLWLKFENSDWADKYGVYLSRDGLNFTRILEYPSNAISITNLTPDSVYYFKVEAVNDSGTSYPTEVLGGIPSEYENDILIVDGFERTTNTNNTFDYIRMYGEPFMQNGMNFSSTSNDAVIKGFVDLNDYDIVIWMLLDESTEDETFNSIEQGLVADYLTNGGKLMVSGAEIGWDLVEKGSEADKAFYRDYLKARYISDAPNDQNATYYTVLPRPFGIFDGLGDINFDDGTHGTIDVDWPDAISRTEDINAIAYNDASYKGITDPAIGFSGISYAGYFDDGDKFGRLVYLAFPFETIYPESQRVAVLEKIIWYMNKIIINVDEENNTVPTEFSLMQNYPNPFNPSTTIKYSISTPPGVREGLFVSLTVYDILGREVATLVNEQQKPGEYEVTFNSSHLGGQVSSNQNLVSGVYLYRLSVGSYSFSKKMILIK
ncbi:MAG: glycosyl hydrolase family 18 protein [Bacteroidota bacterium]